MKNLFRFFATFVCSSLLFVGCSDATEEEPEVFDYVTKAVISGSDSVDCGAQSSYSVALTGTDYTSIAWSVSGEASIVSDTDQTEVTIEASSQAGTATLSVAISVNGSTVSDSFAITVNSTYTDVELTAVKIYSGSDSSAASTALTGVELTEGKSITLSSVIEPTDATSVTYLWSVVSGGVAVSGDTDASSATFSTTATGEAVVKVVATDGDTNTSCEATCTITVIEAVVVDIDPEVGFYYYADGTYTDGVDADATSDIVGVIYKVDAESKVATVIHINSPSVDKTWASSDDMLTTLPDSKDDGTLNMATVMGLDSTYAGYPAFKYVYDLNATTPTYGSYTKDVWYIPADNQIIDVCKWMSEVLEYSNADLTLLSSMFDEGGRDSEASVAFVIGTTVGSVHGDTRYWSSTDIGDKNASDVSIVYVYSANVDTDNGYAVAYMKKTNSSQGNVIALLDFEY